VLAALSIIARYGQLRHPPADIGAQLAHAGLSPQVYALYLSAVTGIFAIICCAVAALILRHRRYDRIGLFGSLYVVLLGLTNSPQMQAVATGYPNLAVLANTSLFLTTLAIVGFFFVFPDGQIVPRRVGPPLLVAAAGFTLIFILTGASIVTDPPAWLAMMLLVGSVTGIGAQIYRYLRVADPMQRQQTKWVVLGVSGAILTMLFFGIVSPHLPTIGHSETSYDLTGVTCVTIASLFIPLSLGVAILRYRLWDIDIVVNRSLVYGALTAGLLGLYLLVVYGVGTLVQIRGHLSISLFATALVAVLFAPLRSRLQSAVNRLMYGERDDPYRVLTRVGERVGTAPAPRAVLQAIAETVASALKSPYVAMTLKEANAFALAASHGSPGSAPLRLPLEYQGETVGELLVAPRGPGEEFSPLDRRLLEDLARQVGPAAHAVRLTADLQRSRERLVTAREEERRRLRRDLHDGLGPQLAALTLKIETIRNRFASDQNLDLALVDLTERTQTALSDIRRLVYALRPPALDDLGFLPAIYQAVEQYRHAGDDVLDLTIEAPHSLPPLPAAVEVATYRIVQEALANVVRHAGASRCHVGLSFDQEQDLLRLQIADDGRGISPHHRIGVGLVSMRERAEELGGHLTIRSSPSGGALITVELPSSLQQEQPPTGDHG
jgi:signal transduction histidine kinase